MALTVKVCRQCGKEFQAHTEVWTLCAKCAWAPIGRPPGAWSTHRVEPATMEQFSYIRGFQNGLQEALDIVNRICIAHAHDVVAKAEGKAV